MKKILATFATTEFNLPIKVLPTMTANGCDQSAAVTVKAEATPQGATPEKGVFHFSLLLARQLARRLAFAAGLATLGAGLAGCAGSAPKMTVGPVGPAPICAARENSDQGSLVVYSEYVASEDECLPGTGEVYDQEPVFEQTWAYSGYRIVGPDGKTVRWVANKGGGAIPRPQQVALAPGKYSVVAEASRYGRVAVSVVIRPGEVTVLHLDGAGYWPMEAGLDRTTAVYFPNGKIIGWRATE